MPLAGATGSGAASVTIDTAAIASAFAAPAFTSMSEARSEKATAAGTAPSVAGVIINASVSAGAVAARCPSQPRLNPIVRVVSTDLVVDCAVGTRALSRRLALVYRAQRSRPYRFRSLLYPET